MATINRKAQQNARGNFNKADAFLNIDVLDQSGKPMKIGGIPLHAAKELHQALIDNKDNLDKLTFDVSMHVVEDKEIKLGFGVQESEESDTTTQLRKAFATEE